MEPWRCASGVRCDVRVATSPKHKQWSGSAAPQPTAATQLSVSASQTSPAEVRTSQQECQFEVVHAKPALIADFDERRRPCVPRILRLEAWFKMLFRFYMFRILEFLGLGDACCSFCHLLTGPPHRRQHRAGVGLGRGLGNTRRLEWFSQKADAMCDYVTILAKTTDEAEVKNSQTAGAAWMRFAQVTPIFGSQKPFAVEGVTPIAKVLQFDMADGEPRLLVGTPHQKWRPNHFAGGKDFSYPDIRG